MNIFLNNSYKKKYYIIINIGAHFTNKRIKKKSKQFDNEDITLQELLEAYRYHLHPKGNLMNELNNLVTNIELKKLNIEIIPIWRDNFPAGTCSIENIYTHGYHKLFPIYNEVNNIH